MRLEMIKRLQIIVSRQAYALRREELEYFQELLEDAEECIRSIEIFTKEKNIPLTQEERHLLQLTQEADLRNRALFNEQFDDVKLKLRNIRMSENQSAQYTSGYGSWQESGVFFDKRGR